MDVSISLVINLSNNLFGNLLRNFRYKSRMMDVIIDKDIQGE